ncbi:MAG TPA: hypothetical protein VGG39_27100 [Polyangiaceae bacterium]|jgi:hypothetical protein
MHRRELEGLRDKYGELLALRVEHPGRCEDERDVRRRMAALAATYPGCLREIDDLALDEIRRRLAAVEAVLGGTGAAEPWMAAVSLFHGLARGALCTKRWLAGRKTVDPALAVAFGEAVGSLAFPEEARGWTDDLARIASPPRGRLSDLVFARIAATLGTSERAARRLVFGTPRRERARS